MKRTFYVLLLAAASGYCMPALAQNNDDMQAMMAYMTPGTVHQMMAKSAGQWSGKVTYWTQPGVPPTTVVMDVKQEMILGGRYLRSINTGNMMGMPFEGIGVTAYDNAKKVFISSWMDNMGTGIVTMEGTWDEKSKSIVFTGKMMDPMTGKEMPAKEIIKFVDDNNQVMEMYSQANGKEYKSMEIVFTRK